MPRAKRHPKLNRADIVRMILWVAGHLDDEEGADHSDAPPGGASLLRWAQKKEENRTDFYMRLLPKAAPPENALKGLDEQEADAAAAHTNKLKKWLEQMKEQQEMKNGERANQ